MCQKIPFSLFVVGASLILAVTTAYSQTDPSAEVSGIIIPRDKEGMYVRNEKGQFEVQWTPKTKVALIANTRLLSGLKGDRLEYKIHSSDKVVTFPVPTGPITGMKESRGGKQLDTALKEAKEEKWIAEHGLVLHFDQKPEKEQLATPADPRFIGIWDPTSKPRTLSINGQKYEISLKKGGQTKALLYNVLTVKDCKPFINRATVIGKQEGDMLIADEIHLQPIGDQAANDDPKLPRYLYIGDSISGNYTQGLKQTLGKHFNLHHPPTNCGPARNGASNILAWLGAYDQPGRHWDVISFNHGHWDAGNDKASYQRDLETVIRELKKTGAKLVWVTTCPVPNGCGPAGELDDKGKAPGRKAGVMKKYMNPWALEVVSKYPEISICDQWQFVKDNEDGIYQDWWKGDNVHFSREPADALGRYLGEHVAELMKVDLGSQPSASSAPKAPSAPAKSVAKSSKDSDELVPRAGIPMLKQDFAYQGKKAYGLYDEADAAAALPDEWKGIQPLDRFDPSVSASLQPQHLIDNGAGGTIDISQPPSAEILAQLKDQFSQGYGLGWYFLPKTERYRTGPGLTGDELLSDLQNGKFPEDAVHPSFTYGFYTNNVTKLYRLYRLSNDPWYVEQIVKYAEGMEWILANRPQQVIPVDRRDQKLADPVATIPHEPIALANFWAHANAARLLLERARAQGLAASDPSVLQAKTFLSTLVKYVASQVTADYAPRAEKRGEEPKTFVPGPKTLALQEQFAIPNRAAQIIEYTPWNQSFFYFSTLAAASLALQDLQAIEGGTAYQTYIDLYRNVVRAGIWNLEDENICVVREGVPYFFHMHTPLRDQEPKTRLGFPMFGGEDVSHSGSGAWNLPYLWSCGEQFGVSPALVAGYTNAMVVTMDDRSSKHAKGQAWPRQHIDNPWYLAASGRTNHPFKGTKGRYFPMMSFAPEIVAAARPYAPRNNKPKLWDHELDLNRLYAGHLYREWVARRGSN